MTPKERAADWFTIAPEERTEELLAQWFLRCENEASQITHGSDQRWAANDAYERAIAEIQKHIPLDTNDRENEWASIKMADAIQSIKALKHKVTN